MNRLPLFLAVSAVSAALLTGCASSTSNTAPSTTAAALITAPSTQPAPITAEFWYALARSGAVNNDTATRALLAHESDPSADLPYAARIDYLKSKGLWPKSFSAGPNERLRRGDLAVALCKLLDVEKGLTTSIVGWNPRTATRALVFHGIYPESTENQGLAGTEFVGIMGALDDRQRGNPADLPAEQIPGYAEPSVALDGSPVLDYRLAPLVYTEPQGDAPIYMMIQPEAGSGGQAVPAGATTQGAPRKLRVFITAVQGDQAEFRRNAEAPWEKAAPGKVLDENAEFRTGDKSSIRFNIPPGQTFTVDRLSTCKVAEAAFDGAKVKTTIAMEQGRVRMDVNETGNGSAAQIRKVDESAFNIAEAGVVHDTQIRSPNSALAVRGTKVSLLDQPPYAPLATSITGRAEYVNTRRQAVAFGAAGRKAQVEGAQTGAAENSSERSAPPIPPAAAATAFDAQQLNRVLSTGGFLRGDVLVGNAGLDINKDFKNVSLGFVLSFGNPGDTKFQDLNLAVVSPISSASNPDFVANGPFTTSLNPKAPGYAEFRKNNYPLTSASGGAISRNSVSVPESFTQRGGSSSFRGAEAATWGANYPRGTYTVLVTNFIDVPDGVTVPNRGADPVNYIVNVIVNGNSIGTLGGQQSVGLYNTDVLGFNTDDIPAASTNAARSKGLVRATKATKPQYLITPVKKNSSQN